MASNVPVSVPLYTQLVDDQDWVLALHPNRLGDDVTALATHIGMLGIAQSRSIDVLGFVQKSRNSFRLAYTDADTITVSIGEIMCLNSGGTIRMMRKNTSTTAVTFSNIDTGARATSTTYYIWAIADAASTTVTFKISTSASAPSGSTYYALVGKFATNATGAGQIIETTVNSYVGDQLVQIQKTQTGAVATGTTTIPSDDTTPQNTEGTEFMTLTVVPQDSANFAQIEVVAQLYTASGNVAIVGALFQDSTANALAAMYDKCTDSQAGGGPMVFIHYMTTGTGSSTTFKFRAGPISASTITFNGTEGARLFGGVMASSITYREYRRVYA